MRKRWISIWFPSAIDLIQGGRCCSSCYRYWGILIFWRSRKEGVRSCWIGITPTIAWHGWMKSSIRKSISERIGRFIDIIISCLCLWKLLLLLVKALKGGTATKINVTLNLLDIRDVLVSLLEVTDGFSFCFCAKNLFVIIR